MFGRLRFLMTFSWAYAPHPKDHQQKGLHKCTANGFHNRMDQFQNDFFLFLKPLKVPGIDLLKQNCNLCRQYSGRDNLFKVNFFYYMKFICIYLFNINHDTFSMFLMNAYCLIAFIWIKVKPPTQFH